jgi:hypothetical protein
MVQEDDEEENDEVESEDDAENASRIKDFPHVGESVTVQYQDLATYKGTVIFYCPDNEKYRVGLSDGRQTWVKLKDFVKDIGVFVSPELPPRQIRLPAKFE